MTESEKETPFFTDISGDDSSEVTEIESICVNCEEQVEIHKIYRKIYVFSSVQNAFIPPS